MSDDIARAIPENVAVPITGLLLKTGGDVPFAFVREMEVIASKWQERCLVNAHLFNGTVYLQARLRLEQGALTGVAVKLDYASFMHWRGNAPFQTETGQYHVFPLAAIESTDGHLIAVRSAASTVNSGLIYFAAGMFDEHDVVADRLDPVGNMQREVGEETGLDLAVMKSDGGLVAFRTGRFVAVFQKYRSCLCTNALVAKIRQFIATQATPEIDDVVVIAGLSDITEKMPGYMAAYCRWHLAV